HFTESTEGVIQFRDIKYVYYRMFFQQLKIKIAIILEKVCKYWYYKARHLNSTTEIPHFEIEPEYVIETLMAADFLDT
ncbi:hypothetical protein BGZ47_010900, partial [Haplosporangium gracile]